MLKKMLHQTVLSACIVAMFAGGYAVAFGGGFQSSHRSHHHSSWHD